MEISRVLGFQRVRNLARLLLNFPFMMKSDILIERTTEAESFDNVSEEEIIFLWRTFKANGLTSDQAWHAIVTGMALDMAFDRSKKLAQFEH